MIDIKVCGKINTTTLSAQVTEFFVLDYDSEGDVNAQIKSFIQETIIPELQANLGPDYKTQATGLLNEQGDILYEALALLKFELDNGQADAGIKSIGNNRALYIGGPIVDNMFVESVEESVKTTKDDGTTTTGEENDDDKSGPTSDGESSENEDNESSSTDDVETVISDTIAEIGINRSNAAIEGVPMADILKKVFPGDKKLFFDNMVTYFKDMVAKQWIDTRVTDGKVVGFNGLQGANQRIKAQLYKEIEGLQDKTASRVITYTIPNDPNPHKLYLYNTDSEIGKVNADNLTDFDSDPNERFADMRKAPLGDNLNQVYAGSEEQLQEVIDSYSNATIISDESNEAPTELNHNTYYDNTGEIAMNNADIFYASTLNTYYDTFLKEYYPGLSEAYQSNHRTGFVQDDTVTSLDQDSAVLKMHKLTTPRLIKNASGDLVQAVDHPYLYEQDYVNVMDELTTMPRDIEGFRTALLERIESKASSYTDVLTSIYNRFFNNEEVSFINNSGEEVTHASYNVLTRKYASTPVSFEVYQENKGEVTKNKMLNDSLSGLITSLTSSAVREKFMSKNGRAIPTNSLTGPVMSDFEDKMKAATTHTTPEGKVRTNPAVFENKKRRFTLGFSSVINNSYTMSFTHGNRRYDFKVKINVDKQGNNYDGGIPIKLLEAPPGMNDKTLVKLLTMSKIPNNLLTSEFINAFKNKLQLNEKMAGNVNSFTEFYLSVLHLMKCNTDTGVEFAVGASITADANDTIVYSYTDNLSGYKVPLGAAMTDTFGPLKSKFIKNLNGDRLALNIVKTKWDDVKRLIRMAKQNPESINANSTIANGTVAINGLYSKAGVSLNGITKGNSELTLHESNQLLIEQSYLQMLGMSSKFNTAMFQMGTMSDRSDVPLVSTTHSDTFLPVVNGKYDAGPIKQECYRTHVAHHKGNLLATQKAWAEVFKGEGIKPAKPLTSMTVVELAQAVAEQNFDYKMVKQNYPVVSNISIDKNSSKKAIIPEGTVQNCIIFDDINSPLLDAYMEFSKAKYIQDLKSMGYYDKPLSDDSNQILASRFPENSKEERKAAMFDSYFYNSNAIGHSLLQLHTGGYSQFAAKRVPASKFINSFVYDKNTQGYKLDTKEAQAVIRELQAYSVEDVKDLYGIDSDEMYYKKVADSTKINDADKALIIVFDEISKTNSAKFIDQSKRNAMSGSGVQTPRMAGKQEPGALIGNFSKAITFDDPSEEILLLGATESTGQDAYDAVMGGHPLYFLKFNNSVGNKESNFSTKGQPIKDITNEVDANGHHRGQKKATFPMFANEMLRKGSPELNSLLNRLNTAVTFNEADQDIFVDILDRDFNPKVLSEADYETVVTPEIWMQNGHALGEVLVELEDGSKVIYNTQALLAEGFERVNDLLTNGKIFTAKVPMKFRNMQELWEYFGSLDNENAWTQVGDVIGYYTGSNCNEIMLQSSDPNTEYYPLRDAYIEKAGFATQEKMGNKNVLPASALTDPSYQFNYVDAQGVTRPRYSEIDNTYHGVILDAGHDYDTAATEQSDIFGEDDHAHDATVSLITQIISANIAQGESLAESRKIYSTLGAMSNVVLDSIRRKIANTILKEAMAINPQFDRKAFANDIMTSTNVTKDVIQASLMRQGIERPDAIINKGYAEYARDIVKSTLATRETGSIASEIVNQKDVEAVTFDLKQMLPLTQSALNAEFNRKAVRNKFPGMQFVVAPSHDFLHTYSVSKPDGSIFRKGVTRDQMNILAYEAVGTGTLADISTHNFKVTELTIDNTVSLFGNNPNGVDPKVISQATMADRIIVNADVPGYFTEGTIITVSEAMRRIRRMYADQNMVADQEAFIDNFTGGLFSWKLGNLSNDTKEVLEWQSYRRHVTDAEGNVTVQNYIDTPEYQMFKAVMPTVKLAKKASGLYDAFVQGNSPYTSAEEVLAAMNDITSAVNPALRNVVSDVVSNKVEWDEAIIRYSNGYRAEPEKLLPYIDTVTTLASKMKEDKEFIKVFEAGAQNILSDPDANWATNPAEFYMPPMHQSAFLLQEGDSVSDVFGLQEQPDKNTLIQAGILNYDEAWDCETNFNEFDYKFRSERFDQLTPTQKAVYSKFQELKAAQLSRMTEFFKGRLDNLIDESGIFNPKGIRGANKNSNINNLISHAKEMLARSKHGTAEHKLWTEVLFGTTATHSPNTQSIEELGLYDARKYKRIKKTKDITNLLNANNYKSAAYRYRTTKLTSMVNNFPASLEFISARIPAQGKQSYIAGVTKEFVFSGRNSCYGPLEMLTATGADYDIDKQNMMTWAVESSGKIVSWKPFIDDDGIISISKFKSSLAKKQAELESSQQAELSEVAISLGNNPDKSEAEIQEILENLQKRHERAKQILTKAYEEEFTKGCQNYVVYNLLKTIKDPKNAIEAATPMAMEKARGSIKPTDYSVLEDASLSELLEARGHAMPYSPTTMLEYERLNMDGKTGVGIFASDLKSYFAIYYAFISDADNKFTKFSNNIPSDKIMDIKTKHPEYTALDPNGLVFFAKNPDGSYRAQTLKTLSNAFRYTSKNQMITEKARNLARDLRNADPERQEELIKERLKDVITSNRLMTEEQAWEDLSELLSASTDNAKELILGRIGANSLTSSIISSMIRCGVDIKDALELINSPEISELVKEVQTAQDTQKTKDQFDERGTIDNKQLKSLVEAKVKGVGTSDAFAYYSNPYVQFLKFLNITEEFSLVSAALSINQGIKNDAYSMWSYIKRVTDGINDVIVPKDKNAKFTEFSFNKFVESVISGDDAYVQDIIKAYDDNKHGINIPYVLYKNSHYLGYFSAMFESKNIRDSISHVYGKVENVIETLGIKGVSSDAFKGIADYIYGVGIDEFLRKTEKVITLNGVTYDLRYPQQSIKGDPGRHEFVKALPNLVQEALEGEFSDNYFLQAISLGSEDPDYTTGEAIKLLKSRDLNKMDSLEYSRMHLGLNDPEFAKTDLYKALYLYSLITNKGSYTQGSFISLFPIEMYSEYMNFIQKNSRTIADRATAEGTKTSFMLHNRELLPKCTTDKESLTRLRNAQTTKSDDEIYDEMFADDGMVDFEEDAAMYRRRAESMYTELFNPESINRKFSKRKLKDPYVMSAQTKMVYGYNPDFDMYMPMTQNTPRVAIPYSLQTEFATIHEAGYQFGWNVNLLGGRTGKILSYIDDYVDAELTTDRVITHTEYNEDDDYRGQYLVQSSGQLYTYTKEALEALNRETLLLNKHNVRKLTPVGEVTKRINQNLTLYFDGTNFNDRLLNDAPTELVDIQVPFEQRADGGTLIPSDPFVVKKLNSTLKFPSKNPLKTDIKVYYEHLKSLALAREIAPTFRTGGNNISLQSIQEMIKNEEATVGMFLEDGKKALASRFVENPTDSQMLKTMLIYMGDEDFQNDTDGMGTMTKRRVPKRFKTDVMAMVKAGSLDYATLDMLGKQFELNTSDIDEAFKASLLRGNHSIYIGDRVRVTDALRETLNAELGIDPEVKYQKARIPNMVREQSLKNVSKPVLRKVAKYLNERFPHTRVKVLSTSEIQSEYGDDAAKANAFVRNGEVIINADTATLDTPIHEFAHIYFEHLKIEDNALFESLIQKALNDPLAVQMRDAYPELSNTDLAEEVLVQMIADYATNKYGTDMVTGKFFEHSMEEDGSLLGKLVSWFKRLFGKMFNTNRTPDIGLGSSLNEVIESYGDSIVFKKGSPLNDFSTETKNIIKSLRNDSEMSLDDAYNHLIDRGFIQKVCI